MVNNKAAKPFFSKRDLLVATGAVVLLALAMLLAPRPGGGDKVRIYLDGAFYAEAPLGENQVILIDQPGGARNELIIQDGQAFIGSATCKNQDCVHQSPLVGGSTQSRALGNWIICLPNKVSVELVAEDGG